MDTTRRGFFKAITGILAALPAIAVIPQEKRGPRLRRVDRVPFDLSDLEGETVTVLREDTIAADPGIDISAAMLEQYQDDVVAEIARRSPLWKARR